MCIILNPIHPMFFPVRTYLYTQTSLTHRAWHCTKASVAKHCYHYLFILDRIYPRELQIFPCTGESSIKPTHLEDSLSERCVFGVAGNILSYVLFLVKRVDMTCWIRAPWMCCFVHKGKRTLEMGIVIQTPLSQRESGEACGAVGGCRLTDSHFPSLLRERRAGPDSPSNYIGGGFP